MHGDDTPVPVLPKAEPTRPKSKSIWLVCRLHRISRNTISRSRIWNSGNDNMRESDLNKVTDAIALRGEESKWCTPSGAFLDLLREFARQEKIGVIAEACRMYFSAYRFARGFVSSALPAIILNHYKPLTDGFDFARFLEWSVQNEDWADQIAAHASSPGFTSVIADMKASIREF